MRSGAAAGVAGTRIERTGARKAAGACARTVGEGTNVWCAIAIKGNINLAHAIKRVPSKSAPDLITANCLEEFIFYYVYVWLFFTFLPTYLRMLEKSSETMESSRHDG